MAVSNFVTPSTAAVSVWAVCSSTAQSLLTADFPAGTYLISAYASDLASTPTVAVVFKAADASTTVGEVATVDNNAADSKNPSQALITITSAASYAFLTVSTANTRVNIQQVGTAKTVATGSVRSITTSGTYSWTGVNSTAILGGGDSGGMGYWGGSGGGQFYAYPGSGGASGYINVLGIPIGTYSVVIGAGGAQGNSNAGGATTVGPYSSANGSYRSYGGSGGSGGSEDYYSNAGQTGYSNNGGMITPFATPGSGGGGGGRGYAGNAGGLYAGGGGGGGGAYPSVQVGGSAAPNTGGGGGGGGPVWAGMTTCYGGAGGSGVVYVLEWV